MKQKLTEERAAQLLADIGHNQRAVADLDARMNTLLAKVKADFEKEAAQHNEAITTACGQLYDWAEANRDELLEDGTKTVRLPTGELSWRVNPPSVELRNPKVIIAHLESADCWDHLIRERPEINKEAILALNEESLAELRKEVKGIKVIRGVETFYVKPFGSEIEQAVTKRVVTTKGGRS